MHQNQKFLPICFMSYIFFLSLRPFFPKPLPLKAILIKKRNPSFCHFTDIVFTKGCINEETISAISKTARSGVIAPNMPKSCLSISCLTLSHAPSINRSESPCYFTILIIPSIFLFEIIKTNHFPALKTPHPLIFFFKCS